MTNHTSCNQNPADRQHWMAVLARSAEADVERCWFQLADRPGYRFIRPPEVGLVMVQARVAAKGLRFHVGETTITRCIIQLDFGALTGFGYVTGQRPRHAELAAVFDALLQDPRHHDTILECVISPLAADLNHKKRQTAAEAAVTKVDFWTLVRGDE